MNAPYKPGEILTITLHDVRVVGSDLGCIDVGLAAERELRIALDQPNVQIERRTPADGVARPGDVWQDASGRHWFAVKVPDGFGDSEIWLTRDGDGRYTQARVHQDYVLTALLFRAEAGGE